ncbi:30S ribosomal protein S17 [Candidatus Roizmanbacteria bacterium CG22_combo_CG10-13_8_21_14_all_38_20]|uniref:Small ribosomal subunit protein uS17 n=1 Tax=Candidatus Roizmanbacteria bacterium CG22_combo_CG10-13_8_21_14_all_38_20 TaxID=1974862 RepID=A0A2H0BWW6_9BACT|nr:30S ribosomal protein S17 [Candidatus Microgenomates bacterium]PIP62162.1 MAG: 30S ribosomal protein S17 [Candidatus Roizmanbacteria bacterium CG22_combo_CG10-13_8_21_14_all_38_20]PJC30900.1 MAG: 30S ribosomal protein S17 [Candidatus Roizmanbacteria bacterium CG_4_9_14_0_2_um_filter_38_17]
MPKRLTGEIVSIKGSLTAIVDVERKFAHPLYKKIIKRNKRYIVHNELNELSVGDQVIIEETRPISKTKKFKVVSKIEN